MKRKNIVSIITALTMTLGLGAQLTLEAGPDQFFSVEALAADDYTEMSNGILTFYVYSDHAEVKSCKKSAEGEITIPAKFSGVPVTKICKYAFAECSELTSVIIPDSVTIINEIAFSYCTSLKSVTIPDSVKFIDDFAFSYCTSLKSITIPASVKNIGLGVFMDSSSLISINVDENNKDYTDLNGVLFSKDKTSLIVYPSGCAGDYIVPNTVETIESSAFRDCENLSSITVPVSVASIGNGAFMGCSGLTDVYYSGTESDWNRIDIGTDNKPFLEANIFIGYKGIEPGNGDINSDGKFSVADALALESYLLGNKNANVKDWKAGDVSADGKLDVFDLCVMKKMLTDITV